VRSLALVLLVLSAGACLRPTSAPAFRYLRVRLPEPPAIQPTAGRELPALRLSHVRAAEHLEERVFWRRSPFEVGYDETLRWSEPPDAVVEDALVTELFETRGFARAASPRAASLRVDVLELDEVLGPRHEAVVALRATMTPTGVGRPAWVRTFRARRPVAAGPPTELAASMSAALGEAIRALADAVADDLR
jgi:uncharacterized lipoprotein YmbA